MIAYILFFGAGLLLGGVIALVLAVFIADGTIGVDESDPEDIHFKLSIITPWDIIVYKKKFIILIKLKRKK